MDTTATHQLPSSLTCDLRIIRAKNLECISPGNLFVRFYLVAANGERIRLNSREVPSTSDPCWNELVSLECGGGQQPAVQLRQQKVVFELRWRSTAPVLRSIVRSNLLGRADIAWEDVLESEDMSLEKWITLENVPRAVMGWKTPALQLGMGIRVAKEVEKARNRRTVSSAKLKECVCDSCNSARDDDLFATAATIDMLL